MLNMDLAGLVDRIAIAAQSLDRGRYGLATDGQEHAGRLDYEEGINGLSVAFKEALDNQDPRIILLADWVYQNQELEFSRKASRESAVSISQGIADFNDALRCLEVLEKENAYRDVEKTYPASRPKFRYKGMPKDAFHVACSGHLTRLRNALMTPGMNALEESLYKRRQINIAAAQKIYFGKQTAAIGVSGQIKQ